MIKLLLMEIFPEGLVFFHLGSKLRMLEQVKVM